MLVSALLLIMGLGGFEAGIETARKVIDYLLQGTPYEAASWLTPLTMASPIRIGLVIFAVALFGWALFWPERRRHASPSDRTRFTDPLKAFVAEGTFLRNHILVLDGAALTKREDEMWSWIERAGMWICEHMGEYALMKFNDTSDIQTHRSITLHPGAAAPEILLKVLIRNLQDLIERDTWDPSGDPILPNGGCRAVVGRASDPPFGSTQT